MSDLRLALLVIGILILAAIYLYGQWEARQKGSLNPAKEGKSKPALSDRSEQSEELSAESAESTQAGKASPQEPQFHPPFQAIPEIRGQKGQEEEFLEELDGLAAVVEEAKDHPPQKQSECAEIMSNEKVKKSRFHFPLSWMKKKSTSEPTPEPPASSAVESHEKELGGKESHGPELIIILTVVARSRMGFRGRDIIQILEERSLQYGEMNIYHAYSPGGRPIFSVANMVEPGTFDLETIDTFTTSGLTLFLRLPGPAGGFAAFDAMLDTARLLAERLHGEIRDERRNVLTTQALEQTRERILTFNRTRRSLGV
jgi:cell division protein ZipA